MDVERQQQHGQHAKDQRKTGEHWRFSAPSTCAGRNNAATQDSLAEGRQLRQARQRSNNEFRRGNRRCRAARRQVNDAGGGYESDM